MLRLIPISIAIICAPLCIPLFGLWLLYAGALLSAGFFGIALGPVPGQPHAAMITIGVLVSTVGGLIGWASLFALTGFTLLSTRTWKTLPIQIKAGCLIGAVSALMVPFGITAFAVPPLLLCAALVWLAVLREEPHRE